jgi:hypothetical protein
MGAPLSQERNIIRGLSGLHKPQKRLLLDGR